MHCWLALSIKDVSVANEHQDHQQIQNHKEAL